MIAPGSRQGSPYPFLRQVIALVLGNLLFGRGLRVRTKIFIDFWNFQLAWRDYHRQQGVTERVSIPWDRTLYEVLVKHVDTKAIYSGTHVYASIDPLKPGDSKLRHFLRNVMSGFPGYSVTIKERRPRSPLNCSHSDCRAPVDVCPKCKRKVTRSVEKGVDTALVTDLIQFASDGLFDSAVLVTADADFVPAVQFIQSRTSKQVVHAYFKPQGQELRNACWTHLYIDDLMDEIIPEGDSGDETG